MKRATKPKRPTKEARPTATATERVHAAALAVCEAARKLPGMYRVNGAGKVEFSSPQALTAAELISKYDAELGRLPWLEEIVKGAQRFNGTLGGKPSKASTKKRRR